MKNIFISKKQFIILFNDTCKQKYLVNLYQANKLIISKIKTSSLNQSHLIFGNQLSFKKNKFLYSNCFKTKTLN